LLSILNLSFRGLLMLALGMIGIVVTASALTVLALRSDAIKDATSDTGNIATVLAEQTARAVQAIDIATSEIAGRLAGSNAADARGEAPALDSKAMHLLLLEQLSRLPQTEFIALIDRNGQLVNTTRVWPPPAGANLGDRDYFIHARDHADEKLFVSRAVNNRVSGNRNVFFAKRIGAPNGEFIGVVLAGVGPNYFKHIYQSLTSIRQQSFVLLRDDGTVLVRHPDTQNLTGRRLPSTSQWYSMDPSGGHFTSTGNFDGVERLIAVRPLKDFPLTINVGIPAREALAGWQSRAIAIGLGTALATICSLLLIYALNHQFAQLAASKASLSEREARLAEKTTELEDANKRIDTAVNNMIQGLVMFNEQGVLVVCNEPYLEIYGLPADQVKPGTSIRRVLELRTAAGNFHDDIDAYIDELLARMRAGEPMEKITELGDGRTFCVTNRPTGGGAWVATHEDITERRRSEKELQRTRNMLRAVVENIPETLIVKDAQTRRYAFLNRAGEALFGVSRDALIGKTGYEIFPPAEAARVKECDEAALRSGQLTVQSRSINTLDGRVREVTSKRIAIGGRDGEPEYIMNVIEDVTERRRDERELRRVRNMLHAVVENIPETLIVKEAQSRRYVYLNRAGETLLGISRADLIGKTGDVIFRREEAEKIQLGDQQALSSRQLTFQDRSVETLDGRVREIMSTRLAIRGGDDEPEYILSVIEDVTERRRDERELQRARNMLGAVVENIPEMLVVKDAQTGRYVFINRAGEEFLGTTKDAVIGKTTEEIFPEDQAKVILARDHETLRNGQMKVDFHVARTLDGRLRDIASKRVSIAGKDNRPEYLLTVVEDITERKRNETRIAHLAHHDPLTDLANRAALNTKLAETVERAAAEDGQFALVCIDLDRFKEVNDLYGHAAGDKVLLEIAARMRKAAGDTFLARLGGDEFMAICIDNASQPAVAALAKRLVDAVSGEIDCDGRKVRIGMSVGVAMYPADGVDVVALLRNADAALYRAKAEGGCAVRFFEADMDRVLHDRRALQADLALAVSRNELQLYYQPQARVSGQIIGFEALLRWDHLRRGFVPPDTFIPLAEETGLIDQIGEWVLREACREAATWRKPLQIAINLSPVQLRQQEFVPLVHSVLLETGLAPERLVLEITEGALMEDYSRAVSILRRLKAFGVRIAMDDFGTGYSSLSYLQSFPFDKIKIDQTFIANLENNTQSGAIVRAVLGLGHSLHLTTVAEGVETQTQLAILQSEGCDEMQGYLIGRPQPISEYPDVTGRPVPERRAAATA